MSASHVLDHGTSVKQSSSSSSTVAAAADIVVGNFIVIVCYHSSGGVVTGSDAHGNSYTTRLKVANGTNPEFSIAAAKVTTQVNSGDLITASYTFNPTFTQVHVIEFTGVDDILDIASPAGATGTGTSPSAAQTTLTAGDLLVGAVNWNTNTAGDATGSGWTESFGTSDTAATHHHLSSFWKIGGAAGSEDIGGTLPASSAWAEGFVAFKATAGGGGTPQAIAGTVTGQSAVAAALSVAKRLQATIAGQSGVNAALSLAKHLQAVVAGGSSLAVAVAAANHVAATVAGVSVVTVGASDAKQLAAVAAGQSLMSVALTGGNGIVVQSDPNGQNAVIYIISIQ